ncbi:hypothetical protein A2707_00070 [Candidatus Saccharibacteria bacterium RIFCSPHIGHO2_01_FULL_45_15]|jgi:transcriptional regulator with XRE-family HTH domain|nr:MAG: hypothetical protein A2707_00070 [Candidatus Saccharibacteria bacterium RIFCSPHIGHO2_01_FULL_45_15]OGL28515.1 MAG: hypothetical protein A3C39_03630 [Candidatus Saccharibacteria bacterium RIFCSPHIGHO2_02_FULL_46_12]OGL32369.1 MAG: hypothetical protein A3E76_04455 [Candidatus Saccharibacteria bacterium RIFCSPHIGHO2_12_FULL_44_22]
MTKDEITKKVARKIKTARLTRNMTQAELAEKAGLSISFYAGVERAESTPSVETLAKLAKALKVKSSDLLPF